MIFFKAIHKCPCIMLCLLLLASVSLLGANYTKVERPTSASTDVVNEAAVTKGIDAHSYSGILRLYIVEPNSRYVDAYNNHYEYGFLGFAYNQAITLGYGDTLSGSITWTKPTLNPNTDLSQTNIMVVGTVSNGTGHPADCAPGETGGEFTAHWTDAVARATDGVPGDERISGPFTHRVFLEEATRHG